MNKSRLIYFFNNIWIQILLSSFTFFHYNTQNIIETYNVWKDPFYAYKFLITVYGQQCLQYRLLKYLITVWYSTLSKTVAYITNICYRKRVRNLCLINVGMQKSALIVREFYFTVITSVFFSRCVCYKNFYYDYYVYWYKFVQMYQRLRNA